MTDPEPTKTEPTAKKPNRTLIIVLSVGCAALLCCAISIAITFLVIIPATNKPGGGCVGTNCITITPTIITDTLLPTPTGTSTPSPSAQVTKTPVPVKDLVIDYTGNPEKVTAVKVLEDSQNGDFLKNSAHYKLGKIVSGTLTSSTTSKKYNAAGKDLFLFVLAPELSFEPPMGAYYNYIHYIKDGNKIITLDTVTDPYLTENITLAAGVTVEYASIDFERENHPLKKQISASGKDYLVFKTTKGASFSVSANYSFYGTPHAEGLVTQVDTYQGVPIYQGKGANADQNMLLSVNGFYYAIYYIPDVVDNESGNLKGITWSVAKKGPMNYAYSSVGGCMLNNLEIEPNLPKTVQVGKDAAGKPILAPARDAYVYNTSFYNNFYAADDLNVNEYNTIKEDDDKPFTQNEMLDYFPILFWQDQFGRWIKLVSYDFFFVGGCGKPVIKIYPQVPTEVSVEVIPNGRLTLTVPAFNNHDKWQVTAFPNSLIKDEVNGGTYEYLWWESSGAVGVKIPHKGFVLDKESLSAELTDLLNKMNLSPTESAEFLEYWLPKMQAVDSDRLFVTFLFNEEVDQIARLNIVPKPVNLNRVFMLFSATDRTSAIAPELNKFNRSGYYVVEWGGAQF